MKLKITDCPFKITEGMSREDRYEKSKLYEDFNYTSEWLKESDIYQALSVCLDDPLQTLDFRNELTKIIKALGDYEWGKARFHADRIIQRMHRGLP